MGYAADPMTGGIIFDDMHEIDVAHYLLRCFRGVASVSRCSGEVGIKFEDISDLVLQHEGSWQSAIHMGFVIPVRTRVAQTAGTRGQLRLGLSEHQFFHCDDVGKVIADEKLPGEVNDDYVAEIRDFLDCIENRESPRCNRNEALAVLTQVAAPRRMAGVPSA